MDNNGMVPVMGTPPMWGAGVIEQYRKVTFAQIFCHNLIVSIFFCRGTENEVPSYVMDKVKDNRRKFATTNRVCWKNVLRERNYKIFNVTATRVCNIHCHKWYRCHLWCIREGYCGSHFLLRGGASNIRIHQVKMQNPLIILYSWIISAILIFIQGGQDDTNSLLVTGKVDDSNNRT